MVNQCSFIGHLGADPSVTTLSNGVKVAQFNIACNEPEYTRQDGTKVEKRIEWIPVVLWRSLADVAEKYVKKGDLVYVQGKFRTRSYDDNNGVRRRSTEIYADSMKMLTSRSAGSAPVPQEVQAPAEPSQPVDFASTQKGDLPF